MPSLSLPALALWAAVAADALPPAAQKTVDFRKDIYPLLAARCFGCHQGDAARAGVRLDARADVVGDSTGRPLVRPGAGADSRLVRLAAGVEPGKVMPPKGERLTAAEVGLLRAWADQGVAWDDALLPPPRPPDHWAFRPVRRPDPLPAGGGWARNPIDAFVAAAHAKHSLSPAAEAPRRVLLRRVTLDLTGLPPTPEELDAFEADASPGAYERRVDRLLAAPAHGERWARHWLDAVRWAESEGYESDHLRPAAWRYRDYVVRSLAADTPFDRFLREQIAGDEMLPYSDDNLIATGFLAAARLSSNEEDRARQRNDVLVDIVNATGGAVLGLTLHCAQCHSHKFDPVSARDYYRFQGFFVKGAPNNLALRDPALWKAYDAVKPPELEPARALRDALLDSARQRLAVAARRKMTDEQRRALDLPSEKRGADEERLAREADLLLQFSMGQVEKAVADADRALFEELKKKIAALEKGLPDAPQTWGFYSPATGPTRVEVLPMKGFYPPPFDRSALARARPYLLAAGEVARRGPEVDVGWPAVFGPTPAERVAERPRSALVDWLTAPSNPLTARVWVNRLWQHHFGRGLVETPNDFGLRGAAPSHPELLDFLASELVRSGWSTRHVHRLIVTSATYRQAATPHAGHRKLDPDNRLLWHWAPRRLEVEAIRDSILTVSGELDRTAGGPSDTDEAKSLRRTLYLLQKRQKAPAVQGLFDGPGAATESCGRRQASTTPLQALYLLNNDFVLMRAQALARRVEAAGPDRMGQAEAAFRLALGRRPDAAERERIGRFFAAVEGEKAPLVLFCQALYNLNEFVTLE